MYPKYSNQGSNLAINGTNPTALPRAGPLAAFYLQTDGKLGTLSTVFPYKT